MEINYKYREGSQAEKPLEIDTTSSKIVVYVRRNIERITRPDPMTGAEISLWGYEEAELTPSEFEKFKTEKDIDDLQYQITSVNDSVIEAEVSMADFMEEYYLAQLGLEVEEGE